VPGRCPGGRRPRACSGTAPLLGRYAQLAQRRRGRWRRAFVEADADRDLALGEVELGQVGVVVASGGDANDAGHGAGGDAQVGGAGEVGCDVNFATCNSGS
jgi:hypothetical protein